MSATKPTSPFRINELTKAQKARLPFYADKWVRIGLSTGKTDRAKAEKALCETYRAAGLEPPQEIIWTLSPYKGALLDMKKWKENKTKGGFNKAWGEISGYASNVIGVNVRGPVASRARNEICDLIEKHDKVVPDSFRQGRRRLRRGQLWSRDDIIPSVLETLHGIGVNKKAGGLGGTVNKGAPRALHIERCACFDFFMNECGLDEIKIIKPFMEFLEHVDRFWLYKDAPILTEKPVLLNRDEEGRFHGDGQAALKYPDGWSVYAHHGMLIPEKWGMTPFEHWSPKWLMETENAEHRRLLIEACGYSRIMKELDTELIHQDGDMELRRIEV